MARHLTYREIAADLADRIMRGEYPPRSRLPSYHELAALYDVGYQTAARAVRVLREQYGMAYGEQGRGLYVEDRRYWRNVES